MSEKFKVECAACLFYVGFRILGATKSHAWDQARLVVSRAIIDKVVEVTGVKHPDGIPEGHMQVTFEGGPAHREVRTVRICGTICLKSHEGIYRYRRTDRKRGDSTIFVLEGIAL